MYTPFTENIRKNNFVCHHALLLSKSEVEEIISDYEGVIIRSRFEIDSQFIDKSIKLKFMPLVVD